MLAAIVGLSVIGTSTWLIARPSEAPAQAPASPHLSAPASRLAGFDGGTLRIGDDVVRLAGISAPARDTTCHTATGVAQDCGVAAANALAALVRHGPIDCAITGRDPGGRPVGECQSGGVSLSEAQVRDGWARAQATSLKPSEAAARSAGKGVWRSGDS